MTPGTGGPTSDGQQAVRLLGEPAALQRTPQRRIERKVMPALAREAADRRGAVLLTRRAGPTANQRRLRPLSRGRTA